jgi:hypothetical protein
MFSLIIAKKLIVAEIISGFIDDNLPICAYLREHFVFSYELSSSLIFKCVCPDFCLFYLEIPLKYLFSYSVSAFYISKESLGNYLKAEKRHPYRICF